MADTGRVVEGEWRMGVVSLGISGLPSLRSPLTPGGS